jgi:hypothetical protein
MDQNELAQLEAERDRLLSMIAYHDRPLFRASGRAPAWFVVVGFVVVCGVGVTMAAGVFVGQISAPGVLLLVVGLPLLAYILVQRVTVLGVKFSVGDVLAAFNMAPTGHLAGEPEVRQLLTECEARIMKLKEGRS